MKAIDGGYLGGHPKFPKQIEDGWVEVDDTGAITYASVRRVNMLERRFPEFTIPGADVRSLKVGVGATVKRGGGTTAFVMGGALGAAAHNKRIASKNTPIEVVADVDGVQCALHFACEAAAALQWSSEVDACRQRAGLAPLLSLAVPESPHASAEAASGGTEIPLVADELRKLADLRDAGVLTEEEFAAQKARLLK